MRLVLFILLAISLECCGQQKDVKIEYFPNGNIKQEATYKNEKLNGSYKTYYENGNKNSVGIYKDNKKEGIWKVWYDNGKLMSESNFKDGKLIDLNFWDTNANKTVNKCNGSFLLKFKNGSPQSSGTYVNCKMHGKWTTWYENGNISTEINLNYGLPTGIWVYWHPDASKYKEEIYEDGQMVKERIYNQQPISK